MNNLRPRVGTMLKLRTQSGSSEIGFNTHSATGTVYFQNKHCDVNNQIRDFLILLGSIDDHCDHRRYYSLCMAPNQQGFVSTGPLQA